MAATAGTAGDPFDHLAGGVDPFGGADFLQEKLNTILSRPGINPADYPLHFSTRLLGTLVQLLPDLVFMMMLWQLRQLFRGYRAGLLFTFEQIRRYRQIGLLLCTTFLVELILTPCWIRCSP